jgi:hypothetical protein
MPLTEPESLTIALYPSLIEELETEVEDREGIENIDQLMNYIVASHLGNLDSVFPWGMQEPTESQHFAAQMEITRELCATLEASEHPEKEEILDGLRSLHRAQERYSEENETDY